MWADSIFLRFKEILILEVFKTQEKCTLFRILFSKRVVNPKPDLELFSMLLLNSNNEELHWRNHYLDKLNTVSQCSDISHLPYR